MDDYMWTATATKALKVQKQTMASMLALVVPV